MVRVMVGLAAWAAGTAVAVSVAWLGADVVVSQAGVRSGLPVINAAVLPPSATPALAVPPPAGPSATGGAAGAAATGAAATGTAATGTAATGAAARVPGVGSSARSGDTGAPESGTDPAPAAGVASPSPSPSATSVPAAGQVRSYALAGGTVTLDVTGSSVQLVTAVPGAGYAVQTWSGTGWLRVDFSSGPQVSSLIASWYQHAPAITVTN